MEQSSLDSSKADQYKTMWSVLVYVPHWLRRTLPTPLSLASTCLLLAYLYPATWCNSPRPILTRQQLRPSLGDRSEAEPLSLDWSDQTLAFSPETRKSPFPAHSVSPLTPVYSKSVQQGHSNEIDNYYSSPPIWIIFPLVFSSGNSSLKVRS